MISIQAPDYAALFNKFTFLSEYTRVFLFYFCNNYVYGYTNGKSLFDSKHPLCYTYCNALLSYIVYLFLFLESPSGVHVANRNVNPCKPSQQEIKNSNN